jgi:hypothetical protein
MIEYELVVAKGHCFTAPTAHDLLYNVGDFVADNKAELLSISISYNQDSGDYTAYVLHE